MSFDALGLAPDLLRAIADMGYTEPTPIQQQAIPAVLARRDIMGSAQTGTGKTASFALPILQLLMPQQSNSPSPARHPVRALALTPTRELALQVQDSVRNYGKYLALRSAAVFGGVDIAPQTRALREGVEIVVATPGRLLDHVQQKTVNLSRVEILVLDEADRMLDMGFMPDIKRILALLPAQRQNLLFSATFSNDIKKLCEQLLRDPLSIEIARRNSANDLVTHSVYEVEAEHKRALLTHLIRARNLHQVLVFTRTKRDADKLARELARDNIATAAIHSDRSQAERIKALEDFKQGAVSVLVATDIAARGLDIEQLPFVINYELPFTAEDYVHRIGRTGRAGYAGEAVSFVSADEQRLLADVEKLLNRQIPHLEMPALDEARKSKPAWSERSERAKRTERAERSERPERTGHPAMPKASPAYNAGFDFSRPYEAKEPTPDKPALSATRKPTRPVAALLGGIAVKKT